MVETTILRMSKQESSISLQKSAGLKNTSLVPLFLVVSVNFSRVLYIIGVKFMILKHLFQFNIHHQIQVSGENERQGSEGEYKIVLYFSKIAHGTEVNAPKQDILGDTAIFIVN